MKLLVIILSIYTVALTAVPCDDLFIVNQDSISISQSIDDVNHNTFDLCSPFCSCVCCASLVHVVKSLDILQLESKIIDLNQYYNPHIVSDYITRNFQPPRV